MTFTSSFWRFLAILGCLPTLAFAVTPTITSVSGSVQTGQTLTIAGSSMVQENRSNWDPLFTNNPNASGFEGSSLIADGYQSGCRNATYDNSVRLMGNQSLRLHDSGAHTVDTKGGCAFQYIIQASISGNSWPADVYYRVYSRWNNTSWPDSDHKYWWISGTGSSWAFFNFNPHSDGTAPTQFQVYASGVTALSGVTWVTGSIPGGPIKNNKWYLFEAHYRQAGSSSPVIEAWIDNQLVISAPASSGIGVNRSAWGWESNSNYWTTPSNWVSDQWQDGFAVSSTRIGPASLVEIGNCSSYGSGIKVSQEPLFLSDGSSQIKADLSGLGSGPYFLWVTNNNNERSLPFSLGGSGTACSGTTALPAPNLRVR